MSSPVEKDSSIKAYKTSNNLPFQKRINNIFLAKRIFRFIDKYIKYKDWRFNGPWIGLGITGAIIHFLFEYIIEKKILLTDALGPIKFANFSLTHIIPKIIIIMLFGGFYLFPGILFIFKFI